MLNWPVRTAADVPNTEGTAIDNMVARALAASAANCRALQQAKAEVAKRLKQESIDSGRLAAVYGGDMFNGLEPEKKETK